MAEVAGPKSQSVTRPRARAQRPSGSVATLHVPPAGSSFIASFMTEAGFVDVDRVADTFAMSKGQLAETAGLALASVSKADRRVAPKAQTRVREMLEIISRVRDWSGGEAQAMAWYRSQPIPALDGRTPEALVKSGRAHAVREYLDHVALGGFA